VGVQDAGVGAAAHDLEQLFDPFFTTKRTAWGWVVDRPFHRSGLTEDGCGAAATRITG